jgi:hypothetical protein
MTIWLSKEAFNDSPHSKLGEARKRFWCLRCDHGHKPRRGDDVLRTLVTGGPPVRGGGGMPRRIIASSVPDSLFRVTGEG